MKKEYLTRKDYGDVLNLMKYGKLIALTRQKGREMKRPKSPANLNFWLYILGQEKLLAEFMARGNGRQQKELDRAKKYTKWQEIQERRG